tara:strand:+ start:2323 stop:2502 length:180 start_codon:yes stop_codon:yes gene_type:complete
LENEKMALKKTNNLDLVIQPKVKITYYSNKQTANTLLLKVAEEDEKIIMSANKLYYKKE